MAAIPVSAFYEENPVTSVVRFCFSKNDATLDTALERLSDAVHRREEGRPQCATVTALRVRFTAAMAAALALCALPAKAQQRTVNFDIWSNYMAPGVLKDFTRETGIKVVSDTFDANETLETRLLAGKSGYDVVVPTGYFLQRQITAKVFTKFDKSKLPNLANAWPVVTGRLAIYDPDNSYGANYMWGTTGIGYNVKMAQKLLWPDAKIDSGTSSSSRRIRRSSGIAAFTCWIPLTISCGRAGLSRA